MKIFKDENQLIYKYFTKKKKTYLQVRWDEFGGSQSLDRVYDHLVLVFFFIIFFTIYYNRTLEVSVLILYILYGMVALVQLLFPIDDFYVGYVM
ncbi:unnamed protein product, partial [Brassica rapa]